MRTIGALIALRILGAAGSSAMLSVSAGSIADMYEPYERGVKVSGRVGESVCERKADGVALCEPPNQVGIYYSAPLLGPA